jgi:hypothetical protein
MEIEAVKRILENAIESLFINQPNIFDFTSETGQTEWNLAHHYANEVHKLLSDLDCDLDVVKINLDNKRPDIIFHSRGGHKSNFLVIEVKRDSSQSELTSDIQKIKSSWFGDRLCYQFGAVVNLKSKKTGEVKVFENS